MQSGGGDLLHCVVWQLKKLRPWSYPESSSQLETPKMVNENDEKSPLLRATIPVLTLELIAKASEA